MESKRNVTGLRRAILFVTGFLTISAVVMCADMKKPSPSNVELAAMDAVSDNTEATLASLVNEKPGGLQLKQAVLSMQHGTAKEGGITLTLVIFTIGHKSKKGLTQTTTVTFGEDKLKAFTANFAPPPFDQSFRDQLNDAVVAASKVHTLPLTHLKVKQEFAVSKDTNGGLTFKIFNGTGSAGATIDVTKTSINSLELSYSK